MTVCSLAFHVMFRVWYAQNVMLRTKLCSSGKKVVQKHSKILWYVDGFLRNALKLKSENFQKLYP
jgi:hypothetical protein